ncbi:CidA/LrgA family protein [Paraferrimonas sp. SM1919]|uniref:CidA/LrgA family protein n=1 Tax=Paraferrimonas sp. SM1919 TaxID=2662263 RepID=UPI0013D681E1|nr:CidA/LrgA family protein [Paraferrimonas sp. SM1919]
MHQLRAISVVLLCYWTGLITVDYFQLSIPVSILAMLILLIALVTKLVPLQWIQSLSQWAMANMSVLFVPVIVALLAVQQQLLSQGWAIVLGTALATLLQLIVIMLGLKKWK